MAISSALLAQFGGYNPTAYKPKTYIPGSYYQASAPKAPVQALWSGATPNPTPASDVTNDNAALSAALTTQDQGASNKGLNYTYTPPASTPATTYVPQAYQVNLPNIDWSFNPTSEQRNTWNTQATATAAQEIDPQLLAIKAALDAYLVQGQNQRNELNPRYTNQSLAIANIIQNSVKQDAIDNAIRRGAETSGWLPSALMQAGQLETQQRSDVEAQRNQDLAQLAALEAAQTQAAGEQNTALEKLRGQRITSALADLENAAWQRDLAQKQNTWNSALGGEQLRASAYGNNASNQLAAYQTQVSAQQAEADRALQAAIAEAEQRNTEWNQNYTVAQDNYQKQLAAARASQKAVQKTPLGYVQGIPYYDIAGLQKLYQTFGLGGYAAKTTSKARITWDDVESGNASVMDYLNQ